MFRLILALITILVVTPVYSQEWRTESLSPLERQYMARQSEEIDTLARRYLGRQFNGTVENDLEIMQLLLDQRHVTANDSAKLQAMGYILGDLVREQKGLQWVVYIDKLGRSRALAIPPTKEFLFPITMISRRVETGIEVDVKALYQKAIKLVEEIQTRRRGF